ncbi:hypothetical protein [Paenibacillus sp. SYP-B4298]|uniref:hypothetical protein n=1 Tax=Paenibacillus sp. SYP-B4298 TaxID=2996034 RepID=UPI0022DE1BAF|nr:hypothetical protein [Paenibacillus sp. SYP-B4298]
MGAESYYVKLGIVENEISKDRFLNELTKMNVKYSSNSKNEFVIEDFLIMTIHLNSEKIQELSIEGCFSWFHECSLKIYEIMFIINNHIFSIVLKDHDGRYINILSEDDFLNFINSMYQEKYNAFLERYGTMNVKCLPREQFYSHINGQRKKRFFKNLFK